MNCWVEELLNLMNFNNSSTHQDNNSSTRQPVNSSIRHLVNTLLGSQSNS